MATNFDKVYKLEDTLCNCEGHGLFEHLIKRWFKCVHCGQLVISDEKFLRENNLLVREMEEPSGEPVKVFSWFKN